ncbi:MAG: hypothetical protein MUC55_00110 [Burkholderiales bacterium]|jgi:hypothetical protein|nr:hypothetical protein [Burkholderiales bacterium]
MPERAPRAELAHAIEGRTRLRFPEHAGNTGALTAIATRLGDLEGVDTVSIRAISGTVVMTHDGHFDEYADRAARAGMLELIEPVPAAEPDALPVPASIPATALAAGAFAALGLFQIGEKRILPPALTLLWYATELFRRAQRSAD